MLHSKPDKIGWSCFCFDKLTHRVYKIEILNLPSLNKIIFLNQNLVKWISFIAILQLTYSPLATASIDFELELTSYNGNTRKGDGTCCDPRQNGLPGCDSPCDPGFHICLDDGWVIQGARSFINIRYSIRSRNESRSVTKYLNTNNVNYSIYPFTKCLFNA